MPQVDLNAVQAALAAAHGDVNNRIVRDAQRFQRHAEKKQARFQREGQNNQVKMFSALSASLGFQVPMNAVVIAKPDGGAVLEWQGADPRQPAETPPAADPPAAAPQAAQPEPAKNGTHEHAGAR